MVEKGHKGLFEEINTLCIIESIRSIFVTSGGGHFITVITCDQNFVLFVLF